MKRLYSYNQLKALYGKEDRQVKRIKRFINNIGDCISDVFCSQELDDEDTEVLEKIISEFLTTC